MCLNQSELACSIDTGDTAWTLTSTVLILGMMPGLAFFEAGLLRTKNTISIITQVLGGIIALAILWNLIGFSLVFGGDWVGDSFIGSYKYGMFFDVSYQECWYPGNGAPPTAIPAAMYAMFEMQFACITPLLLTGAVAERLKYSCFFIINILWEILVFYPLAHWMWSPYGWLYKLGALDFAGGIVIHTSAGAGAIVLSAMLGRRIGFEEKHGEFTPSSLPLAGIGAAFLWIGWFGFNAGSALSAGQVAISAIVSTQLAAVVSGLVWLVHIFSNIFD
eukprot:TRINITY_DN3104_c0_g1_i2.p1 TRINITY_DN3104_c0_g1~~TRINITY_DN3104_c0_g1_i2.p1  ORF type:complete len:276 (+),score=37.28 TRINITY_DN3104_c0_g1_i2:114-941(+)